MHTDTELLRNTSKLDFYVWWRTEQFSLHSNTFNCVCVWSKFKYCYLTGRRILLSRSQTFQYHHKVWFTLPKIAWVNKKVPPERRVKLSASLHFYVCHLEAGKPEIGYYPKCKMEYTKCDHSSGGKSTNTLYLSKSITT